MTPRRLAWQPAADSSFTQNVLDTVNTAAYGTFRSSIVRRVGSVTQVGTPSAVTVTGGSNSGSVTGTWSGTQPRTAGDVLIAVVTAYGTTSAGTVHCANSAWAVAQGGNAVITAGSVAETSMWVCYAEGGDAAPAFTTTSTGTAASAQMTCSLIELTGADYNSTVPVTGGITGTTAASLTVTGGANVPCAGCYAITSWNVVQSPAATQSWTPGSSWVNKSSTGAGTYTSQAFCDVYANPPAGAALSEIGTHGGRTGPARRV